LDVSSQSGHIDFDLVEVVGWVDRERPRGAMLNISLVFGRVLAIVISRLAMSTLMVLFMMAMMGALGTMTTAMVAMAMVTTLFDHTCRVTYQGITHAPRPPPFPLKPTHDFVA